MKKNHNEMLETHGKKTERTQQTVETDANRESKTFRKLNQMNTENGIVGQNIILNMFMGYTFSGKRMSKLWFLSAYNTTITAGSVLLLSVCFLCFALSLYRFLFQNKEACYTLASVTMLST